MSYDYQSQKETFKIVSRLTSGRFKTEENLLKALIRDVVAEEKFDIIGGRLWKLDAVDKSYSLKYQVGKIKQIEIGYSLKIQDQPILDKLHKERTLLNYETDEYLQQKGIKLYSVIGVGEIVRSGGGRYYEYVIGFNAEEILQTFYDTLNIIAGVATMALKTLAVKKEQKKIRRDLIRASEIQNGLLPEHKTTFMDYDIYGVCRPDQSVGGDYFDFIRNADDLDERLGIVITDAAGHGLPAAIQSLFVSGAVKMAMSFSTRISHLFHRLNRLIFDTLFYERFVTMFYCELTKTSNRLGLYASAGHTPAILYSPSKDRFEYLNPTGGFLGVIKDQRYQVENFIMRPGDVLLIYTDGIDEAQDSDGVRFGNERLEVLINSNADRTAEHIALKILEAVEKFADEDVHSDDKTLVVVKRKPE